MNPFINSVRKNIGIITNEIGQTEKSDVRLALVEFRDHPPEVIQNAERVISGKNIFHVGKNLRHTSSQIY